MRFEETGTDSVFTSDNVHLGVGTHKDLRIYHNSSSSNNNIENHSGSLYVTNYVDDGDIILRSDDGSGGVTNYLQLDGGSKFLSVPSDSVQFTLGASSDIRFYHDGSNSQLKNYTGAFYISQNTASTLYIDQNADDSDIVLRSDDGSGGTTAYLTLDGSAKNINFFGSRIYLKNDGTFHWGSSGAHGVLSWDTGRAIVSGLGSNNLDLKAASGYQVVVNETQSNVDFRVESDSSANLLHCDATLDKIGIGTNAPLSKLHVEGKAFIGEGSTNETEFPSNTASLHIHEIVNDSSGVDLGNEAHMVISTGVNATGAQGYQGSLWFGTSDHPAGGTGSGNQTQFVWRNAGIASYTSADTGAGSASGNLEFFTNNASSTATKRMTITEAGLVGIGIASPTSPLHVYAGDGSIPDDANNHLLVEDNAHSYIGIGGGTSSDTGIHFMDSGGIRGRIAYKHSSDSMDFKTANSVQMTIDSNGDVGIGTTSPGTKLEIKAGGDTSQEVIKIRNNSGTEIMTIAAIDGSGDGYINFNSSPGIINTNSGNLNLDPAGDVVVDGASLYLPVAEKLYFGAGGHTYIGEDVDDRLRFFTRVAEFMRFTEDTANILSLYQNTYLNDDLKLYFGSHSDVYMYYEPTNDEFYIRNVTGDTKIRNEATDADIIFSNDDGSGGNTNYMVIDGGAVSIDLLQDTRLKAAKKLFLDGGGNTYIYEESADNVMFYIGGRNMLRLHEGNGEVVAVSYTHLTLPTNREV